VLVESDALFPNDAIMITIIPHSYNMFNIEIVHDPDPKTILLVCSLLVESDALFPN